MFKYFDQADSMVQFLYLLDHRNRWTLDLSAAREYGSSRLTAVPHSLAGAL
jgi:hypothetical protein